MLNYRQRQLGNRPTSASPWRSRAPESLTDGGKIQTRCFTDRSRLATQSFTGAAGSEYEGSCIPGTKAVHSRSAGQQDLLSSHPNASTGFGKDTACTATPPGGTPPPGSRAAPSTLARRSRPGRASSSSIAKTRLIEREGVPTSRLSSLSRAWRQALGGAAFGVYLRSTPWPRSLPVPRRARGDPNPRRRGLRRAGNCARLGRVTR
jgi:hypothetical protein